MLSIHYLMLQNQIFKHPVRETGDPAGVNYFTPISPEAGTYFLFRLPVFISAAAMNWIIFTVCTWVWHYYGIVICIHHIIHSILCCISFCDRWTQTFDSSFWIELFFYDLLHGPKHLLPITSLCFTVEQGLGKFWIFTLFKFSNNSGFSLLKFTNFSTHSQEIICIC